MLLECILSRYLRTICHLSMAIRRADLALLYGTSVPLGETMQPPRLVVRMRSENAVWTWPHLACMGHHPGRIRQVSVRFHRISGPSF